MLFSKWKSDLGVYPRIVHRFSFLRVDVETLLLIIYNNSAFECLIVASVPNEMFIGQSEVAFNSIYKAFRF